jgi:antitoxin MazE
MSPVLQLQVEKRGNSLGIRLPKIIVEIFHLREKDKMKCSIKHGKLFLEPIVSPKRYVLEDLLAQVKEHDKELSWGKPEGNEFW